MTRIRYRALGSLSIVLALVSCSGPTDAGPSVDLVVQTDKTVYSLAVDSAAQPILINRGSVAVYAPMNEYVAVQRFAGGAWQAPRPWFTVDGVGISFAIHPGDTLKALAMNFAYVGRAPGLYRFLFEVAYDSTGHRLVAEAARVSPAFELRP